MQLKGLRLNMMQSKRRKMHDGSMEKADLC